MAALGALIEQDRRYADIASEIHQFTARIVGPSLNFLGTSIEVLRLEGLIETVGGDADEHDAEWLRLTGTGRRAFKEYLQASIRLGDSDFNRLVIALKLRFITVLEAEERLEQLEGLKSLYERECARLDDLARQEAWSCGLLPDWLAFERDVASQRITWCGRLIEASRSSQKTC